MCVKFDPSRSLWESILTFSWMILLPWKVHWRPIVVMHNNIYKTSFPCRVYTRNSLNIFLHSSRLLAGTPVKFAWYFYVVLAFYVRFRIIDVRGYNGILNMPICVLNAWRNHFKRKFRSKSRTFDGRLRNTIDILSYLI